VGDLFATACLARHVALDTGCRGVAKCTFGMLVGRDTATGGVLDKELLSQLFDVLHAFPIRLLQLLCLLRLVRPRII